MSSDFLRLARELSMLSVESAEQLVSEATRTGDSPESLVARRGLMSAVQMDIVRTLLRPGDVVPGYELLTSLGHGGMGVVYRAKQKTLDRVVAIKTILVNQISDRSIALRFEQEARAVARLQHPNIITAFDFGQHDGRLFFVMELVDGEDLESLIQRQQKSDLPNSVSETLAWGLARQTAMGLSHAAEQGIVHRDIKPANLLLVEPPTGFPLPSGMPLVKIADFGLAFLATAEADARTRLTSANTTVGSPLYIAPEQISGEQVDARADIYSLGATIFHLLAGRAPYSGRPMMQILSLKTSLDAPRLRSIRHDISDATDTLVADMMARRPEDRIASYSELLGRIDEVCRTLNSASLAEVPQVALTATEAFPRLVTKTPGRDSESSNSTQSIDTATPALPPKVVVPPSRISRRAWLALSAGIGLTSFGAWAYFSRNQNRPVRLRMVSSGWSEPLFDGRSLRNWQPRSGTWGLADDDDGAKVLAGTNGVIARRLVRSGEQPARPLSHYAVTLAVRLHRANAIELHFGLFRDASDNAPRLAVRVERETAWLVVRSADPGTMEPRSTPVSLPAITADQPRVIRLHRDATHWIAFADDQRIATLPIASPAESAEFRLLVEAGPAWFSDIEVEELVEPTARK